MAERTPLFKFHLGNFPFRTAVGGPLISRLSAGLGLVFGERPSRKWMPLEAMDNGNAKQKTMRNHQYLPHNTRTTAADYRTQLPREAIHPPVRKLV